VKPSQLARHSKLKRFARNSSSSGGHSDIIIESISGAGGGGACASRSARTNAILSDGTKRDLLKRKRLLQRP
jgi:hypothetical protein